MWRCQPFNDIKQYILYLVLLITYNISFLGPKQNLKKKRTVGPFFDLHYKCEWKNCAYETDEDSKFHVHVSYHIPDVEVKTLGTGEGMVLLKLKSYWKQNAVNYY